MATQSHAQAVKSLNNGAGRRRFVFKTFSQRIEDIDVDVFRSLDPLKQEPSEGSSFFRDCLVEWRELNTAEDFISFYEEMLPLVQTLPQIILQKEIILSNLLSRLDMKGRLSLEPILRLIAALSRDLLEDFIPFLQKVADSMVLLLGSGADRESEIIEQIFTSWSCIMMYLQKYLMRDVVNILKVTKKLRFYPKDYIQEFMAESVSFVLRNAPVEQINRGVKKLISEIVTKPLETRKSGASALLFYVMRGFSSKLHSRAEHVLQLLLHNEVIGSCDKDPEGSNPVIEVVITVVQRLCEELQSSELKLLLQLEQKEIYESVSKGDSHHLTHLLSLFISTLEANNMHRAIDFEQVLELVKNLIETFLMPSIMQKAVEQSYNVIDNILQLMLCVLDGLHSGSHAGALASLSMQWAPIFEMRNKSFMKFVKELLSKDASIVQIFRCCITSALTDLVMISEDEAMYLLVTFFEKLQSLDFCLLEEKSKQGVSRVHNFLQENITCWIGKINDAAHKDPSNVEFTATDLAHIWGTITCYSYMTDFEANHYLLMEFVEALDRLLMVNSALPRRVYESLIGAGLASYQRLSLTAKHDDLPVDKLLYFAKKYKLSIHILSAVADFLDSLDSSTTQADSTRKKYRLEFEAAKTIDAFNIFSENLCHSDKQIRLLTLRILCHYESLRSENDMIIDDHGENVLHSLLAIEATSLSIATSRKVVLLISKIQMDLSAKRIHDAYIPLVFNAVIGIFHNRFNYLWNPAMECFVVLVNDYPSPVWETCMKFLDKCVSNFASYRAHSDQDNSELHGSHDDLLGCFNQFVGPSYEDIPSPTVLSLLIKSLQKVSTFVESRSRQIIPLFLKFLGYEVADLSSVRSFSLEACKGKVWKSVLGDWLSLLKLMRNPKAFYLSQFIKDVLQYRLLDENDFEVQLKVLDCLLNWKDEFLFPYAQNLRNLVNPKTLRDELTRWSLSRDSHLVSEQHRDSLVPLVIRLLVSKVRNLKTLASRKAASMHHRKAVIAFLAELDINELSLFFALLIKPLQIGSSGVDDVSELIWSSAKTSANLDSSAVLSHFTMDNIKSLSSKKIYGFLHVIEEILGVFDESRVKPVLDTFMGSVVRILASCASSTDEEDCAADKQSMASLAPKQLKDLRSLCLKIISSVLSKFDDHDFSVEFWDIFFSALKPLIDGFKQEGASSEKPSSLFVCFLAMSKSHKLVSQFQRANNLVPDIFSILTVPTASEAIISCVLRFIENLLNLDNEVSSHDSNVKGILLPNVNTLVCCLHHLYTSKNTSRKSLKPSDGKELSIFKLLPKYIEDPSLAKKFVDILLPSLTKKPLDWDSCVETMHVIQKMVPMLGSEGSSRMLNTISPLLIHATSDVRLAICGILDLLAASDPSLVHVAELLRELNATSSMEMDVLDYDVIISAYEKINIDFFCSVREEQTLIILSHCVHDMSSQDLILRNSAYRLLLLFLEFCQKIISSEMESNNACWTEIRVRNIINNFFLKYMGDAMNRETSVIKVWMDLLREMVLRLPNVSKLESLHALCNEDPEQDFFNNIVHLQKHRRARALMRFCSVVRDHQLSEVITHKVLVPLFYNMLLEVKDGKGEHLRNACIEALASISGSMSWKQYYALLNKCFKEVKLRPDRQKLFLRLISSIIDHFHFQEVKPGKSTVLVKCTTTDEHEHSDVQNSLHNNVLPKVQKLLTLDTDNVNVNVSLVALKLLKLLPGNVLEVQLPTIIHRVSNFLKNRLDSVRDEARSALAACLKELGLEYLQFVLNVLRSTLKRGFELHVLGYTVNFILSKCLTGPVCGKLDYCLEDILSVVENDVLGEVSEEKEVDKIASKMKETRKKKSFETLELVAENVTFKTHALKIMSFVTRHLQKQLTPKLKSKLETMLRHIALGIERNPTVNQEDILIFTYGFIEDDVNGNQASQHKFSHLVTVFALGILHNRIKKMITKQNIEQVMSLLDPFVGLLCGCLSSKFEDITSASLRCLSLLVKYPLPSLKSQADNIKTALFVILHGSVNAGTPLAESCIRLLTVLLKSTSITLSSDQMHMLLQFPVFVDLQRTPSIVALSLLKAIVRRKVVVPEIYDLANQVAELMVTSQVKPIRKKCSMIFLRFLLDYSLSGKRLQQHLDFLLSNLRYEHPTGRQAVLDMLIAIIMKFPQQVLDEQSQTIFLQLVVCLANDCENEVRSLAGVAIKYLIMNVGSKSQRSILNHTLSWFSGEKQGLWSAAAQVLGLMVEETKKGFAKHIDDTFPIMRRILSSAVNIFKNGQADLSCETTIPLWKEAYYSLVLFEKILLQFPHLSLGKDLEDIWEMICEFLLYPHIWLRNISNRLIALYFKSLPTTSDWTGSIFLTRPSRMFFLAVSFCSQLKASLTDALENDYLRKNTAFAPLKLDSMWQNKKKDEKNDKDGKKEKDEEKHPKPYLVLWKNIVFAILRLHSMLGQEKESLVFWSNVEQKDEEILLRAFVILDSRKGRSMFASLASGLNGRIDVENCENYRFLLISSLVKTMGKIALDMEEVQMRLVFDIFGTISPKILDSNEINENAEQKDGQTLAYQVLLPLYKICEGFAGKVLSDEAKQFAQAVRDSIRDVIEAQNFSKVYNSIRKNLKAKRDKRKQGEKIMAVVNPERNAKRKLRIAAKHKVNKKRKIMTMKFGRNWVN
ncbi:small subunit processome component 20 homolog isoform X2 [Helianthus annuus]|uniref:small subunit processome component 20 homolog isoform X2 n=1 Tax=Helianthus annuus TaxID=4232 RepID=UPI000B9051B1|nr:small subunit processome component 20 homolog isoform X2 [Helianthus annuus]